MDLAGRSLAYKLDNRFIVELTLVTGEISRRGSREGD